MYSASGRDLTDVKKHMMEHPEEPVVSIYEKLKKGVLCCFPVDDVILYSQDVRNKEILPYMDSDYTDFPSPYIWALIERDRNASK